MFIAYNGTDTGDLVERNNCYIITGYDLLDRMDKIDTDDIKTVKSSALIWMAAYSIMFVTVCAFLNKLSLLDRGNMTKYLIVLCMEHIF